MSPGQQSHKGYICIKGHGQGLNVNVYDNIWNGFIIIVSKPNMKFLSLLVQKLKPMSKFLPQTDV